jgi:cell division protein FtsL
VQSLGYAQGYKIKEFKRLGVTTVANKIDNIAYDFSLFESSAVRKPKEERAEKKKADVVHISKKDLYKSRRVKYKPLRVFASVVGFLAMLGIIGVMISNQIVITDLNEKINNQYKMYNDRKSEYTQLQMKVESKLPLQEVERYAKEQLGMTHTEPQQIQYINTVGGDKGEVNEETAHSFFDKIKSAIFGALS